MKIICISDTHERHHEITQDLLRIKSLIDDDAILIHAGDVSGRGSVHAINEFLEWFSELPFTHKVFIAGNHDFGFERIRHRTDLGIIIPDGVTYLMDEMVEIAGIKIYGSPWQPRFLNWAFNVDRGTAIAEKWENIPVDADIVITHGPAYGMVDYLPSAGNLGCEELIKKLVETKPKLHVCGHIHYAYGVAKSGGITFVNASNLDEGYQYRNKPIVLDYDLL